MKPLPMGTGVGDVCIYIYICVCVCANVARQYPCELLPDEFIGFGGSCVFSDSGLRVTSGL